MQGSFVTAEQWLHSQGFPAPHPSSEWGEGATGPGQGGTARTADPRRAGGRGKEGTFQVIVVLSQATLTLLEPRCPEDGWALHPGEAMNASLVLLCFTCWTVLISAHEFCHFYSSRFLPPSDKGVSEGLCRGSVTSWGWVMTPVQQDIEEQGWGAPWGELLFRKHVNFEWDQDEQIQKCATTLSAQRKHNATSKKEIKQNCVNLFRERRKKTIQD